MIYLIGIVALLAWITTRFGEKAGAIAMLILGGIVVIALLIPDTKGNRAWANRREYWSMSGKDRAKARHRCEEEARREEERERRK